MPTIPPSEIQRSASLHHPQNPPHAEAVRKHSFHSSQSPVKGTISNKQGEMVTIDPNDVIIYRKASCSSEAKS